MSAFVMFFGKQNDEYALYKTQMIQIGPNPSDGQAIKYKSYVADTQILREQGLSGKKSLPSGTAMLFVFENPSQYGFWMKDMNFPIDILWFTPSEVEGRDQKKIVFVKENATPESYPEVFSSTTPAQYVLELPAGEVARNHFQVTQKVEFLGPN